MSFQTFTGGAAPATPAAGKASFYVDTNEEPRCINSDGVDMGLANKDAYNWLRNSGMWFAQRQSPGTLTTYNSAAARAITADGWGVTNENASVQYQRTDTATAPETGLSGRYYGTFTKITNTGKVVISQVIEGTDTGALRGSTVRLQLWMKSVSSNFTVRIALAYLTTGTPDSGMPASFITAFGANGTDPTLGTNLAYITPKAGIVADGGTIDGNGVDCAIVTTDWTRFGAVFDVPSTARNLVVIVFSDSQMTAAQGIAMSQVSITAGQAVQEWSPMAYPEELARVQRFYAKSFNIDTLPAQNAGLAGAVRGHANVAGATAGQVIGVRFPVPMRVAPTTITTYNPSAANAQARNTTAAADATATATANAAEQAMEVTFTGVVGWLAGQSMAVHYTADAEI